MTYGSSEEALEHSECCASDDDTCLEVQHAGDGLYIFRKVDIDSI